MSRNSDSLFYRGQFAKYLIHSLPQFFLILEYLFHFCVINAACGVYPLGNLIQAVAASTQERNNLLQLRDLQVDYNLCKSGILVNDLASRRSRDTGVMRLVNQVNRMLPYLAEIYDLPLAA